MTRSTLQEKQDVTGDETVDSTADRELVFRQSTTGSFRQFLLATGAIFLSLLINLGLLAFIGYVDRARNRSTSDSPQTTLNLVELQQLQEVRASKPSPSENQTVTDSPSGETTRKDPPKPEPVAKTQPLELDRISSNFDVDPPRVRLNTSTTFDTDEEQPEKDTDSSSGSSGTEQGKSFRRGKLDKLPRKTSGPDPAYPVEARRNRTEGWVMLELDVSRDGTVSNVEVLDWTGSPDFKQSALEAVRKWTFQPGQRNGSPVNARDLRQRIRFELVD